MCALNPPLGTGTGTGTSTGTSTGTGTNTSTSTGTSTGTLYTSRSRKVAMRHPSTSGTHVYMM